jgi:hypothetical protein
VVKDRAHALIRVARTQEGALFVAILTLLVAGVVAAVVLPRHGREFAYAREGGSLLAPPSDARFTESLGAPAGPSAAFGNTGLNGRADRGGSRGSPNAPPPKKRPPVPPPTTPPGNGLLPDLPVLPPLPPPPGLLHFGGPFGGRR